MTYFIISSISLDFLIPLILSLLSQFQSKPLSIFLPLILCSSVPPVGRKLLNLSFPVLDTGGSHGCYVCVWAYTVGFVRALRLKKKRKTAPEGNGIREQTFEKASPPSLLPLELVFILVTDILSQFITSPFSESATSRVVPEWISQNVSA